MTFCFFLVPRAVESQLVIDNLQFFPELSQRNSSDFRVLAEALEDKLKAALFTNDQLNYGAADIEVKVLEFM